TGATWSDVAVQIVGGVSHLYAALGTPGGAGSNAVFHTTNPTSNAPVWFVGDETVPTLPDTRTGNEFPAGASGARNNGNIKISANGLTIYAAVTNPFTNPLLQVFVSTDGGRNWAATGGQPGSDYMGTFPNGLGQINSMIAVDPTNSSRVYVASYGVNQTG